MENSENDTHFKNIIALATEKKLSWETVHSIVCDEMALTFEETKQLVKVLLEELQTMQIKVNETPIEDVTSQSKTVILRESVTFLNESNDIKLENDPFSNTEEIENEKGITTHRQKPFSMHNMQ